MFRYDRAIPAAVILALGFSVSACSSSGKTFDPTDWMPESVFGSKEKLQGERKPVFPNGVPGVPEGVPSDLIKGQQAAIETEPVPPAAAPAEQPAPAPQTTQPAKPKPKPKTASAPAAQPKPAASPQQNQQSSSQSSEAPWPNPSQHSLPNSSPIPEAGTFSR